MRPLDKYQHRLSVAPMMEWTDRHCRVFLRALSRHVLLYSEMISVEALLSGGAVHLLARDDAEGAVVAQLGGSDPERLADCARMAEDAGFVEVNLNAGCPSHRVQRAGIGAALMRTPRLVAQAVAAMKHAVSIPVTVKHRIGVDGGASEETLAAFVSMLADAGCDGFIVHARTAILRGLNPKQNRRVPALRPDIVYRLKQRLPGVHIEYNGGVENLDDVRAHLERVDGVMVGRAAYKNPYLLARADETIFEDDPGTCPSREAVLVGVTAYAERMCADGTPVWHLARHLGGLFHGMPGARRWRRFLSEHPRRMEASPRLLEDAIRLAKALEAPP